MSIKLNMTHFYVLMQIIMIRFYPLFVFLVKICIGEPQIDNVEDNDELTEQNEKMICDTRMLEQRMKMHYPPLLMIIHA